MQKLIAILLSASLLLAAGRAASSQEDSAPLGQLFQLIQTIFTQAESRKTVTTTEATVLYSTPSPLAKTVMQLSSGTQVELIRSETVLNVRWCFVQADGVKGWVKESSLNLPVSSGAATLPANVAAVKSAASVYSSYNQSTRVLAQLEKGAEVTVLRRAQYSGTDWVYATVRSSGISGWLLESGLNMPNVVTNLDLSRSELTYLPTYAQLGYVISNRLNIRTAPGTNFDQVGAYSGGERVGILETNSGWGRTVDGWIYLGYVYFEVRWAPTA